MYVLKTGSTVKMRLV